MTQENVRSPDKLPKSSFRILRLPELIEKVGLSRAQIYHLIALGEFPSQIKLGLRACGWLESEVTEWIKQRITQSRKETV